MQGANMAASAPEDRCNDAATFFLDIGLRSLAGGNAEAALDRLGTCAQHLRAGPASTANGGPAGEQLGAVLGSQVRLWQVCGREGGGCSCRSPASFQADLLMALLPLLQLEGTGKVAMPVSVMPQISMAHLFEGHSEVGQHMADAGGSHCQLSMARMVPACLCEI